MLSVFTVEGYGATETAAGATMTLIQDYTTGHVGPPIVCCDIKFKDVPEMNYINTPNQPQGEICIRGPHVFKHYYKNTQKYKECFDEDGFYLSGDIGVLTDDKAIKIVDRKSNIIKLSQGEFVSLESLEGKYLECDLLLMGWVYGDGLKSSLVSILVVNPDTFLPWARNISSSQMSIEELCNSDLVKTQVLSKLNEIASKYGLKKYEFIKAIHLEPQPFSPENGLITPTLKVKRKNLKQYYQLKLDELYKSIGQ
jgi:long-chain acyl-CoA synthetase